MKFKINFIENNSILFKLALAIFLITFFILFIFEPFGDIKHGFLLTGIIRLLSYALTASISFFIAERFIKHTFIKFSKKTIYLPVYWYLIEIILVTVAIFFCRTLWVGFENTTLSSFFLILYRVLVIAVIPYAFIMLLVFNTNKFSKRATEITFKSKDKNPEYLKLSEDAILYLKSDENYTTIYFKYKNLLKSKMLRGSLSYFEENLDIPFLRIHRSYVVNINAVEQAEVNSQGGKILLNFESIELRVARKFVSNFKLRWDASNSI